MLRLTEHFTFSMAGNNKNITSKQRAKLEAAKQRELLAAKRFKTSTLEGVNSRESWRRLNFGSNGAVVTNPQRKPHQRSNKRGLLLTGLLKSNMAI